MNNKSIPARVLVAAGGSLMNFVLAFVLFFILVMLQGYREVGVAHVAVKSPAYHAGIRVGDRITHINKTRVDWASLGSAMNVAGPRGGGVDLRVRRDGEKLDFSIVPVRIGINYSIGISARGNEDSNGMTIRDVNKGSPAANAGLKKNDIITHVNGVSVEDLQFNLSAAVNAEQGAPVVIHLLRDDVLLNITVEPVESSVFSIGVDTAMRRQPGLLDKNPEGFVDFQRVGLGEGILNTTDMMIFQVRAPFMLLAQFIAGEPMPEGGGVMGPIGLGGVVTEAYQESIEVGILETLLTMMFIAAFINAALGVMNLLPIPALDGSRIIFLLVEAVRRKRVPPEKEAMVHFVGLVLILVLAVVIAYQDIVRFI
jgi:regulator of sigma E protease